MKMIVITLMIIIILKYDYNLFVMVKKSVKSTLLFYVCVEIYRLYLIN